MFIRLALAFVAMLASCDKDETLTAYGAGDRLWLLAEIDAEPFAGTATLTFPQPGEMSGAAPCNSYAASQTAPYPWFAPGPIRATRRACPALAAEGRFLTALAAMTLVEVAGEVLVLSNDEGEMLVFHAAP